MLLKQLLLTEIIEISKSEWKYKIIFLDSLNEFEITETFENPKNYGFIRSIFTDNVMMPFKTDVKFLNRLIKNNPLFFNAVYLKKDDEGLLMTPMTVDDIAIIPNVQARGFARCKDAINGLTLSIDNLNGGN